GVRGLLARSYIVEDLESAIRVASALREQWPGGAYTVVTGGGDVLTEHTLSGGSGLAPSRIEPTAELDQAEEARARVAERRAEAARAEADRARHALVAVEQSVGEAAADAERAAQAFAAAEAEPRPILDASQRDELLAELERARSAEIELRLALETARERARAAEARRGALADQFEAERQAAEEAARRAVLRSRQVAQAER